LVGVSEVYVHNSVRDKLIKKVSESEVLFKKMSVVLPYQITSVLGQYLNVKA
jgi:hypothetical protein